MLFLFITSVHMGLVCYLSLFCSLLLAACFHWLKDLGGWELEAPLLVGLVLGNWVVNANPALMCGALGQQSPLSLFSIFDNSLASAGRWHLWLIDKCSPSGNTFLKFLHPFGGVIFPLITFSCTVVSFCMVEKNVSLVSLLNSVKTKITIYLSQL